MISCFSQQVESLGSVSSLSSSQLEGMSAAVLRDLVGQLQEDLVAAAQRNAMLQRQLQARGGDGGGAGAGAERRASASDAVDLHGQVGWGCV